MVFGMHISIVVRPFKGISSPCRFFLASVPLPPDTSVYTHPKLIYKAKERPFISVLLLAPKFLPQLKTRGLTNNTTQWTICIAFSMSATNGGSVQPVERLCTQVVYFWDCGSGLELVHM